MSGYEIGGVAFGILSVWLIARQRILGWPAGIVNVSLFIVVFHQARLYADMGLQVVYVALCAYGWYAWARGGPGHGALVVRRASSILLAELGVAGLGGAALLGAVLHYHTDASLPFVDAATASFSLVAQWLQTRKYLENWALWIAVDVVYVGMYLYKALYLTAGLYAVFLVLALVGWREWRRSMGSEMISNSANVDDDAGGKGSKVTSSPADRDDASGGNALQKLKSSPTPFRVVVTGAECTGKTTLARELGERFGAPVSPEFARTYQDHVARPLGAGDVEPIAGGQIANEDTAAAAAGDRALVVLDTDLVSTVTYARYYYGACPAWIALAARARRADLYLLLRDDVPWVPDGLHRDGVAARAAVETRLEAALHHMGAHVVSIDGGWTARRAVAFAAVEAALPASAGDER